MSLKRRLEEEHRDERYVRERRDEEVAAADPPRIAGLLQYAGAVIVAAAGIFVILRERHLGLKRLRDTPMSQISTMADDEADPDAPVSALAKAS